MGEKEMNRVWFEEVKEVMVMVSVVEEWLEGMRGDVGEFVLVVEVVGRIREGFLYWVERERFVNVGRVERIWKFVGEWVSGRIEEGMIVRRGKLGCEVVEGYII